MEKLKVIIADDERELAQMVALRLRAAGMETRLVEDGQSALRAVAEWSPDVLLTDISMPGLDGWQLCRALERDPALRRTPIVAMTAWVTPDLERRAREAGVARLLLKPFDERRIVDVVAAASKRPRRAPHADGRAQDHTVRR